jgi:hypothetical protein
MKIFFLSFLITYDDLISSVSASLFCLSSFSLFVQLFLHKARRHGGNTFKLAIHLGF